jgi:hypothetical protein
LEQPVKPAPLPVQAIGPVEGVDPVKREPVLPVFSVKVECPVRAEEKVSDELAQPELDRVEIVRNGSVAKKEPLVVAVSTAPAIPYTRRSPCEGESESQPVGCLSELVAPVTLPLLDQPASAPVISDPASVFDPALVPWMPTISPVEITFVEHHLKPDGSCSCGDTGCDGPPSDVMVDSESVCSSTDVFKPSSQVSVSSTFASRVVTSVPCRSPNDEKKMTPQMTQMTMMNVKNKNNNNKKNAAGTAAGRNSLGVACQQRTLKRKPLVRSHELR